MQQIVDVAKKLELTSIALGCLTRKEICAAFARVNPNTVMTLPNSYNWQSGRSIPRNFGVFEDWATVCGIDEGPHFVMSSSLSEFVRVLGDRFGLPDELLASFGPPPEPEPSAPFDAAGDTTWSAGALLRGSFLAVSPSWSPVQRGRLLAGAMTFEPAAGNVVARYQENILGRTITFSGTGRTDGQICQLMLECEANRGIYLMAFHLPPLPGNFAGGVFAGSALYDPNSEPMSSAIVLLRNHALTPAELVAASEYMDPDPAPIANCLERLGYGRDDGLAVEQELLRLLDGGDDRPSVSVRRDLIGRAAVMLDRRRFETQGQA